MIYTVTLNPALDYIMDAGDITFGATNRSGKESFTYGGKGINVSVILARLGISSTALGFIGGFTGDFLAKSLEKQGILTDFTRISSENTRINVKLRNGGEITEVNAAGPKISLGDLELFFKKLQTLKSGDTLVLAGSVPNGVDKNIYADIMQRLFGSGIRFVVDTTGDALLATLKFKPFLIKPNKEELEQLFGGKITGWDEMVEYAFKLKEMGAVNVLVSLGEDGAVLVDEQGKVYKSPAKKITPVNTVGAGDSMVAGFIAGCQKGYEYALGLGIAAGSATAASQTLATAEQIEKIFNE